MLLLLQFSTLLRFFSLFNSLFCVITLFLVISRYLGILIVFNTSLLEYILIHVNFIQVVSVVVPLLQLLFQIYGHFSHFQIWLLHKIFFQFPKSFTFGWIQPVIFGVITAWVGFCVLLLEDFPLLFTFLLDRVGPFTELGVSLRYYIVYWYLVVFGHGQISIQFNFHIFILNICLIFIFHWFTFSYHWSIVFGSIH